MMVGFTVKGRSFTGKKEGVGDGLLTREGGQYERSPKCQEGVCKRLREEKKKRASYELLNRGEKERGEKGGDARRERHPLLIFQEGKRRESTLV